MEDCYNAAKRQANMNLNPIDDLLGGRADQAIPDFLKG
jgi:hypothetical protein